MINGTVSGYQTQAPLYNNETQPPATAAGVFSGTSLAPTLTGVGLYVTTASTQLWAATVAQDTRFDGTAWSSGAFSNNPATGVITCNTAGTYLVTATFNAIGPLAGSGTLTLNKNGVAQTTSFIRQASNVSQTYTLSAMVALAATNTLTLNFVTSGGSGNVNATDGLTVACTTLQAIRVA